MSGKRIVIVLVVLFSLMATLPVAADAAGVGTVYEGVSVPGIALGDSRAQVEAVNGPPNSCVDFEVYGAKDHCGYSVEGGGSIGVRYRAPDGGTPSGSPRGFGCHDPVDRRGGRLGDHCRRQHHPGPERQAGCD